MGFKQFCSRTEIISLCEPKAIQELVLILKKIERLAIYLEEMDDVTETELKQALSSIKTKSELEKLSLVRIMFVNCLKPTFKESQEGMQLKPIFDQTQQIIMDYIISENSYKTV